MTERCLINMFSTVGDFKTFGPLYNCWCHSHYYARTKTLLFSLLTQNDHAYLGSYSGALLGFIASNQAFNSFDFFCQVYRGCFLVCVFINWERVELEGHREKQLVPERSAFYRGTFTVSVLVAPNMPSVTRQLRRDGHGDTGLFKNNTCNLKWLLLI